MDVRNKTVVVTGAGRGIGRATSLQFADRGADVALFDLNASDLEETAALCAAKSVQARGYRVNVADESDVTAAMTRVAKDFGRLDGLVNNAGIVRDGLLVKVKDGAVVGRTPSEQIQRLLDEALQKRLSELRRRVATVALSALLVGLLASLGMALSWTRPISRVSRAFDQIGRGEWNIDLGVLPHRRDEIGFLSRSCVAMAGKLAELDQLKDDLVAAVSHEFRSPLAAIESYLDRIEVVRKRGDPPESWVGNLEPIRLSCVRLERFVDDLLDVAYFETGKLSLDRRTTDLTGVAQEVLKLFEFKFREKRLTCQLRAADSLPRPVIDPERIRQVLTNLVSNAMKFTPEGGRIDVHLDPEKSGKSVRITVKDNGVGIAAKDQARIFNKFEQVKSARAQVKGAKGSGLGLAMSRALVELHGGEIGVKSEPGLGSEFFFTLPIRYVPAVLAGAGI